MVGAKAHGLDAALMGIGIDKGEAGDIPLDVQIALLADATASHVGLDHTVTCDDVLIRNVYLGEGYGIVGDLERRAIRIVAETEGILLDPVYTGRGRAWVRLSI
jgi:L-cysteate sulfo-lyase